MSRFLKDHATAFEPERLRVLQTVYDLLEDIVSDKTELATALLGVPDDRATIEQVLIYVGERFGWAKNLGV